MLFQILLTSSFIALLVHGQRFSKFIQSQPRMGYSSSVVHTNPESNDLHSESSVHVNFHPQQKVTLQSNPRRGAFKYLQTNNNAPGNTFYTSTSADVNPQVSNSFNVGYNISFSGADRSKRRKPTYTRANNKKPENSEVITGRSKKNEKVQAPGINMNLSPKDFVSHAFLKQKQINSDTMRYISSPLNAQGSSNSLKFIQPIREHPAKFPSQSPKFTYNTQQNIFRDVVKATKPDPIQLGQEFKTSYQTNGKWNNIGSGLEVSKSIETQIPDQNYGNSHSPRLTNIKASREEPPQRFNHDSALRNSQPFDFSNAHGEILYKENEAISDSSPESSEHIQRTNNYELFEPSLTRNNIEGNFNNQQFSDLNNINIEAHIPARLKGVKPLPIDTSLLKDVVLTTDFRDAPNDPRVIPIRFDISKIQTVMNEQLAQVPSHNQYLNLNLQNPSHAGLSYGDHEQAASNKDYRIYRKPEHMDIGQYGAGYNYDRKRLNFDDDVYKIVSMRPPPVELNVQI